MELKLLPGAILPWYRENKRALPWRETDDPYRIWVSEIMLQQTRVEAVKGYYARFLEALPDIASLTICSCARWGRRSVIRKIGSPASSPILTSIVSPPFFVTTP